MVRNAAYEHAIRKDVDPRVEDPWDLSKVDAKTLWPVIPKRSAPPAAQCWFPATGPQSFKDPGNPQPRAFATIYLDHDNQLRYETSASISSRKKDIFKRKFCQNFQDAVEEEEGYLLSGAIGLEKANTAHESRRSSETSTTKSTRHIRRTGKTKRALTKATTSPTKRYKSNAHKHLSSNWSTSNCSQSSHSDYDDEDEDEPDEFAGVRTVQKEILVSDKEALKRCYDTRFRQIQQLGCKTIAKAWVKVVEPKKQAHHPYNGGKRAKELGRDADGEVTKPDWWPPKGCRHKEPDHTKKDERLVLLLHILRDLSHKGITVERLEASTDEILGTIKKQQQRDWLKDVYSIRKIEERFLRDEIDPDHTICVTLPDQKSDSARKKQKMRSYSTRSRIPRSKNQNSTPVITPVSNQQQSPTGLVSPIHNMVLNSCRQERAPNKPPLPSRNDDLLRYRGSDGTYRVREQNFSANSSFSSSDTEFAQNYEQVAATVPSNSYVASSGNSFANNLNFAARGSSQPFALPEPSQLGYRERASQMCLPAHQQEVVWSSPSVTQAYQNSSEWAYSPATITGSSQEMHVLPQIPLPQSSTANILPLPLQQPTNGTLPEPQNIRAFSHAFDGGYSSNVLRNGSVHMSQNGLPDYHDF